ncbi:MAG: hypothetical protein ABIQ01_02225 [Pseudolysinimonas sp.]
MTGRHAATPDELFDQQERDRAGAHRADIEAAAGPAAKGPARKRAPAAAKAPTASETQPAELVPQKKASTS